MILPAIICSISVTGATQGPARSVRGAGHAPPGQPGNHRRSASVAACIVAGSPAGLRSRTDPFILLVGVCQPGNQTIDKRTCDP